MDITVEDVLDTAVALNGDRIEMCLMSDWSVQMINRGPAPTEEEQPTLRDEALYGIVCDLDACGLIPF